MTGKALCLMLLVVVTSAPARAASEKPATVKLAKVLEGLALEVKFEDRSKLTVTTKGTPLRAGTYWVKSLSLYGKDEKGRVWEMRCTGNFGSLESITVASEQEKVLLLGPPITLSLGARQGKGAEKNLVRLQLGASGVASESYFPGAYLDGKRAPAPTFKITAGDGKVLQAGRFDVSGNSCVHEWRIPTGFTGPFDVEVTPTMGPFKWAVRRSSRFEVE